MATIKRHRRSRSAKVKFVYLTPGDERDQPRPTSWSRLKTLVRETMATVFTLLVLLALLAAVAASFGYRATFVADNDSASVIHNGALVVNEPIPVLDAVNGDILTTRQEGHPIGSFKVVQLDEIGDTADLTIVDAHDVQQHWKVPASATVTRTVYHLNNAGFLLTLINSFSARIGALIVACGAFLYYVTTRALRLRRRSLTRSTQLTMRRTKRSTTAVHPHLHAPNADAARSNVQRLPSPEVLVDAPRRAASASGTVD